MMKEMPIMRLAFRGKWIMRRFRSFILLLPPIYLALLVSCANVFTSHASSSSGTLSIKLSNQNAKTILPQSGDYTAAIASYKITVTGNGNTYTSTTVSSETCTITGIVAGSNYAADVKAYSNANATTQIAEGSASDLTISGGSTTSASVTLSFSQTGTGGISLPISWPTSTTLPYVYANLDSASTASFSLSATGATSGSNYTATIAQSNVSSGSSHLLYLYFSASSTATGATLIGPFIESVLIWDGVTDTAWVDPTSGDITSPLSLTAGEFASSNASLAGLSCANADGSSLSLMSPTTGLAVSFAAGTTSYTLSTGFTGTSVTFTVQASIGSQKLSCQWNGSAQTWTRQNGDTYTYTASGLALVSGTNTFAVTVTAPDKQTTQTYTVAVSCGAACVTVGVNTSYEGLGFPSAIAIIQGQSFAAETGNATLDAIASGWAWYIDGVAQSETSQRFLLSPSTTSSMLGTYNIAASVKGTDGVTYSGRTALTVNRLAALNLSNTLSVLAGGTYGSGDGTGTGAQFSSPIGITTDGINLYVVDNVNNDIRKIVIATGVVTTLVSSGLSGPNDITTDGTYLYVTNQNANTILKVAIATGIVTTLAGSGISGSSDGTGTGASFNLPAGITTDGTNLYVCDMGNNEIRQVVITTGQVITLVGSSAGLNSPYGITTDGTNLYICDSSNEVIRKVVISSPTVTTLAGTIGTSGNVNATGTGAEFSAPLGIVSDGTNLYVADKVNYAIRQIVISSGVVTTLSCSSSSGDSVNRPYRITTDGSSLYFVQPNTYKVQRIQ